MSTPIEQKRILSILSFLKIRRTLLVKIGALLLGAYLLLLCPATKMTWERLIDWLSNRNPPTWLVPAGDGTIDVPQTKIYKKKKLLEFKTKVHVANEDLMHTVGLKKNEWTQYKADLSEAGSIFIDFWGISVVSVEDQTFIVGEKSQPMININDQVLRWQKEIEASAKKYQVEPALIAAVMEQESGGDPAAESQVGAIGLMQLMPATARSLGIDPIDPVQNIDGGAHYLQEQLQAFGSVEAALAAYNAGPGNVENRSWVKIPETIEYVQNVPRLLSKYERIWKEADNTQK